MDTTREWTRTLVHTEDFKESQITVSYYTDGIMKGSYTYDVHSPYFPHHDPIAAGRGSSISDCVKQAKKSHKSFWGPLGVRRL